VRKLNYNCADCGVHTRHAREYYMVENALWKAHGAGRRLLCIGCLEARMGRQLTRDDFKLCLLNLDDDVSDRLRDRRGDFAEVYGQAIHDGLRNREAPSCR
jgi:hypothetical protein